MDPFNDRISDVAYEIRELHGNKQRVRGPYRLRQNAQRELTNLYGTWLNWEIVEVIHSCRCVDEQPETSEAEWQK